MKLIAIHFALTYSTPAGDDEPRNKEAYMLWTIFVILLVLWALGLVTSYTLGGFIHLLLVLALVVLVINLLGGRTSSV
jgi:hypothetical protein